MTHPHDFSHRRTELARACPGHSFLLTTDQRHLRYLTGISRAAAIEAVLWLGSDGREVLYLPTPDPHRIKWDGPMLTAEQATALSGIADIRPTDQLTVELPELLRGVRALGYRLGGRLDDVVLQALERASRIAAAGHRSSRVAASLHDPRGPIGRLRVIKDGAEQEALREAATLTAAAHLQLMKTAIPGETGRGLRGRFEATLAAGGAEAVAYESIVAVGTEATCLHARPTSATLAADAAVLVDAGAQVGGYASDLTRSWPVGARFSPSHATLYDIVLEAQLAALARCRSGATLASVHAAAMAVLEEGQTKLGLPGPVGRWAPHHTSHWIGLDVHDAGPYEDDLGEATTLAPGMVFTVEPGLYADADADDAPESLRGLGVRIEDVVLIAADGSAEVLTAAAPKDRDAIEALREAALVSG